MSLQMSIPAPSVINEIDMESMLLIMRGYTSSYSLWNYAQENKTEYIKPVAYKNVNQRFLRLARLGYIEEVELGDNPHRRIDYKLKIKGLEQLIPYLLTHPNELENVVKYMNKFGLDTEIFSHLLFSKFHSMRQLVSKYERLTTGTKYDKEVNSDWISGKEIEYGGNTSFGIFSKDKQDALVKDLLNQMKEGLMEFDPDTLTLVRTKKGSKFVSVPIIKLTANLLNQMHLAPTTMQLQKEWEEEEEEFKHEEKLQSKMTHNKKKK